jgi:hypothetical protein
MIAAEVLYKRNQELLNEKMGLVRALERAAEKASNSGYICPLMMNKRHSCEIKKKKLKHERVELFAKCFETPKKATRCWVAFWMEAHK